MKKQIGYAMMATPFVAEAAVAVATIGVVPTLCIFAGIAALLAWIWFAFGLLSA